MISQPRCHRWCPLLPTAILGLVRSVRTGQQKLDRYAVK